MAVKRLTKISPGNRFTANTLLLRLYSMSITLKKYARVRKLTRSAYARVEVTIRAGGTVQSIFSKTSFTGKLLSIDF